MDDHTTTKLDAFRSLVQKAGALHAELATLDAAICELDSIKAQITDCSDDAKALQLIAALRRAEEIVTVKRLRESRLRGELDVIVKEAEFAHFEIMSAIDPMLNDLSTAATQPFRDLLESLQPEEENSKRDWPLIALPRPPLSRSTRTSDQRSGRLTTAPIFSVRPSLISASA